jgi:hypothetical protein
MLRVKYTGEKYTGGSGLIFVGSDPSWASHFGLGFLRA